VNLDEIQSPLPARNIENITPEPKKEVEQEVGETKEEEHVEVPIPERESNVVPMSGQNIKKKDKKSILFLVLFLAILVIGGILLFSKIGKKTELPTTAKTNITYWGLWEDENVMQTIISEFETKNPNIKINYKRNQITDYRTRLKSRI